MVELARDPSEQCCYVEVVEAGLSAYPPRRCLNKATLSTWPLPPHCEGPHRYTVEQPFGEGPYGTRVHPFGDGRNNWEGKPEHRVVPPTRDARQRTAFAWAAEAFGEAQTKSIEQRALRLLEEAIELYQAAAGSRDTAAELVQFVFDRPPGTVPQEVGGVSVCMLVLCAAADLSAELEEERELERVLAKPASHWKARNDAKNAAGFLAPSIGTAPAKTTGELRDDLFADRCTPKSPTIATGNAAVSRDAYEDLLKYTRLMEAQHDAVLRDLLASARTTLRRVEGNNEIGNLIAAVDAPVPIPMIMHCPACHQRHVDGVAFAEHPHHTHACQHCGFTWRPAVANTVGVQFLPGFKDEEE